MRVRKAILDAGPIDCLGEVDLVHCTRSLIPWVPNAFVERATTSNRAVFECRTTKTKVL